MASSTNRIRLVGGVFLGIALYQFLSGGPWVVWVILGFLLGGFSFFGSGQKGSGEQ